MCRVYLETNPPAGSGYRVYHDTNLSRLGAGSEYRVYCDTIPAIWELDQVKGLPGY